MACFSKVVLAIIFLAASSSAIGQECQTDPNSFWICQGDVAFDTGYLIPPSVLDLNECRIWEQKAALVADLLKERDAFQSQRDVALEAVSTLTAAYNEQGQITVDLSQRLALAESDLDSAYTVWHVVAIATAVGIVSVGAGVMVGVLAD